MRVVIGDISEDVTQTCDTIRDQGGDHVDSNIALAVKRLKGRNYKILALTMGADK